MRCPTFQKGNGGGFDTTSVVIALGSKATIPVATLNPYGSQARSASVCKANTMINIMSQSSSSLMFCREPQLLNVVYTREESIAVLLIRGAAGSREMKREGGKENLVSC